MALRRVSVSDIVGLTSRSITDEGYLVAPGVLATSDNVQMYSAGELGLTDMAPDARVGLYRPVDEVSSPETLASFDGKPITLDHPRDGVTAANWRDVAVGDVRGVAVQGKDMAGTLTIRDKAAVDAVMSGKTALSNGYSFELDPTPGMAADGTPYFGKQRRIRGNHTAIVDSARGGPVCRIADSRNPNTSGDRQMALRKLVLDGLTCELDENAAVVVEKIVGDATKALKAAQDASADAGKALAGAQAALKAETDKAAKLATDHATEVAKLTAQILKPEQVEALVAERTSAVGDAAKLVADLKPEGKTVHAIRCEVLAGIVGDAESPVAGIAKAVLAGVALDKAEPASVKAAFDACVAAKGTVATDTRVTTAADVAKALTSAGDSAADDGVLDGRELFLYRESHGGKDPQTKRN